MYEEVRKMKDIIETMKENLSALENGAQVAQVNQVIEVIVAPAGEDTSIELGTNFEQSAQKDLENKSEEDISNKFDPKYRKATRKIVEWLNCEICTYKCKSEITLKKHTTSKHMNLKSCSICSKQFDCKKIPHTGNKESLDRCG